ncbi:MAG: adenylosuccinate synthase [Clostridia bacterium]|nr:adenylosuccinate synthase [Clostridia bacterium]
MLCSICGINWGDEGKGRMVDMLSSEYDVVVRYQGGNNAGHTVINEKGRFILNLLPSGILRGDVVNVMGPGMVIDIKHLCGEIQRLRDAGIEISPENLKISDKAVIVMPYSITQDVLEEERLSKATGKPYGSTRRGISPIYADKYMKKALRMGELKRPEFMYARLKDIVEWKNLFVTAYGAEAVRYEDMVEYLKEYGEPLKEYVTDVGLYIDGAAKAGKNVLFEAQLGALRDIDYGIVPYTSASSTIAAYAPIGAGVPNLKLDKSIGIMKAYSTCVGEGPFTAEYFGEKADRLREIGGEYGAATGRPRRVGPFDAVASKYGVRCQGADEIALTKLDVLDGYERIEIVDKYILGGAETDEFPFTDALDECRPHIIEVPGWNADITGCREKKDLPKAALDYIALIENLCDCKVRYVSVGAERDACVKMY